MTENLFIKMIRDTGESVLALLYPDICPFCGRRLKKEERGQICKRCQFALPYIYEPKCKKCGKPLRDEHKEYCWDCEKRKHFYDRGVAVWEHRPAVAQAIYQFKYHNRRIYGRFFAREMVKSYESMIRQWNISLIVPIPISKKRKRQRGYNQAGILAKEVSRMTGIPCAQNLFVRVKDTTPQKKLGVKERRLNLMHAFAVKDGVKLPSNILVIDDIYTTGNTMDMAAYVLKKAGAENVFFMTISIGQGY